MLRAKQTNDLDFFTVQSASPNRLYHSDMRHRHGSRPIFHEIPRAAGPP